MTTLVKAKQENSASLLAAVGLVLLTILTTWKLKQLKYKLRNEPGVAMVYGALLGLAAKLWSSDSVGTTGSLSICVNGTLPILNNTSTKVLVPHMETFGPEGLFNLFLPPIIFHGAYTLNQKRFMDNLGSIMTFAFLGTFISCMIIGACVYGFTRLASLVGRAADGDFYLTDCLLFGAIMSATDPVSVLGLLSELNVDPDLYTLLFGESVLNDAVAIVLTHAISSFISTETRGMDPFAFFLSVGYFLGVLAGSFFVGFLFTVITALLTKFTRLCESPLLETVVFFLLSWSSFLSAESSGLSGIVAVMFCGLGQARYTFHNLSPEAQSRTKQLFEAFHFLGEIFIFSYMGYVLLTFTHHVFKALFISGTFLSIFISRAFNIYPLSFLLNLRRTRKIPPPFQHFMMFSGLRGAVAFSLVLEDRSREVKRAMFTTTLLVIGFTTWVFGTASELLLRRLGIRVGVDVRESTDEQFSVDGAGSSDTTQGLWSRLDYKYIKPALTHCGPQLRDSLPDWCRSFTGLLNCLGVHKDEEHLYEAEQDVNMEKDSLGVCTECESGAEHQEDLLEGDLGLGNSLALREA